MLELSLKSRWYEPRVCSLNHGAHTVSLSGECWLIELGKSNVSREQGIRAQSEQGRRGKGLSFIKEILCLVTVLEILFLI